MPAAGFVQLAVTVPEVPVVLTPVTSGEACPSMMMVALVESGPVTANPALFVTPVTLAVNVPDVVAVALGVIRSRYCVFVVGAAKLRPFTAGFVPDGFVPDPWAVPVSFVTSRSERRPAGTEALNVVA